MSSTSGVNGSPTNLPPSLPETVEVAAADYLPKLSKLEQARRAIYLKDLQELAADERETVKRYREKTVFGNQTPALQRDDMGDIIVCDDYHVAINQPQPTRSTDVPPVAPAAAPAPTSASGQTGWLKPLALAAALLGGSGIGAGVPWLLGAYGKQAVTNTTVQGTDRNIGIEVIKGGASQ